jgi:hypothetical protein
MLRLTLLLTGVRPTIEWSLPSCHGLKQARRDLNRSRTFRIGTYSAASDDGWGTKKNGENVDMGGSQINE